MLIEIFKTGKHTDQNNNTAYYDANTLAKIAATYNRHLEQNPNSQAPLVKGHPKDDKPAEGWIKKLIRRGKTLYAEIENINPNTAEEIKSQLFKNISVAMYPNLMLKHVGLLGAATPAVKGLNKNGLLFYNEPELTDIEIAIANAEKENNNKTQNTTAKPPEEENSNPTQDATDELYHQLPLTEMTQQKELLQKRVHELERELTQYEIKEYVNEIERKNGLLFCQQQKQNITEVLTLTMNPKNINENNANSFAEANTSLTEKLKTLIENLTANQKLNNKKQTQNNELLQSFMEPNNNYNSNTSDFDTDTPRGKLHADAINLIKQSPNTPYYDAIMQLIKEK